MPNDTTDNFSTRIPDVLFALGTDPNFEEAKEILRDANRWLAANSASEFFPAIQAARNRLGQRVANHFINYIIEQNRIKNCRPPVAGDEPEQGWCPE